MRVAYCSGFWCTNVGNGFFSMGVEYALKKVLGEKNVTVVSDLQTYTTSWGKRLYVHPHQLVYLSELDVDHIVLAGPVLSQYFLDLWEKILLKLQNRGIGYILLSAGTMKLNAAEREKIQCFFQTCPPYALSSRDEETFAWFGKYAKHAYQGICYSFFVPDCYSPVKMPGLSPYVVYNFDKINEPVIQRIEGETPASQRQFCFEGDHYSIAPPDRLSALAAKTDRFTDALIYAASVFPARKTATHMGDHRIIRTDHRFHPHFRRKIYHRADTFAADLPYGYLNLYANAELTLSDRVHACAVTLAFGHSAMLFAQTGRCGLLTRVGAAGICDAPVRLDMERLAQEKQDQLNWLRQTMLEANA